MTGPANSGETRADELVDLLEMLDRVTERLPQVLDDTGSDTRAGTSAGTDTGGGSGAVPGSSVTGTGGEATENRAIRHARATVARSTGERLGAELAQMRARVRSAAEEAGVATLASRQARAARSQTREEAGTADTSADTDCQSLGAPARRAGVGAELAAVLDTAARRLLDERADPRPEGVERTLQMIVAGAIESIPHVQRAGVSLVGRDGVISSRAPSDTVVAELDELQNTLREGPCRDAVFSAEHVLIDDMRDGASRWARFAPAAEVLQVRAMLAFPLFTSNDGSAGALNLYSDRLAAFDQDSIDTGSLFASHAALALHGARRVDNLNTALATRDLIGQAKGILTERLSLSDEQAFALLVSSSQETNLKLREVARWVVTDTADRLGRPRPADPDPRLPRKQSG